MTTTRTRNTVTVAPSVVAEPTPPARLVAIFTTDKVISVNEFNNQVRTVKWAGIKTTATMREQGHAMVQNWMARHNAPEPPRVSGQNWCRVVVKVIPRDNRRQDAHNKHVKPILDGITDMQVWQDDSQVAELTFRRCRPDRDNPRVEFWIYDLGTDWVGE